MKKIAMTLLMATAFLAVKAADKEIKLDAPDKAGSTTLMQALDKRASSREYSVKPLSGKDLSDLLWAANGVNREESGMRTAASALNKQDVDIYVVMPEATYLYQAKGHLLTLVAEGDFRGLVAGSQAFVNSAPVSLVLVSELGRFNNPESEQTKLMGAADVGIVSANISLFCSAAGLSTVPRATMDVTKMREAWKLTSTQLPILNHPVGYRK